jgi:hypothetical protein
VALAFTAANLMFFTYSLGISLINVNTIHFWNSAPTWIGNLIPLFINGFMVAGKIVENKRIRNNQTKISSK